MGALAAVAPLALTNLVEIEAADAGPPLRLARVEAFAADDAANDSRWHDEILPPIAAHLLEAGRSGLLFAMTYGNGGGCTFKVVARTRSGALVDFILAAGRRAAAPPPLSSRAALMISGALGVKLNDLLLDRVFRSNKILYLRKNSVVARIRDRTGGLWVSQQAATGPRGGKGLMDPTL